MIKYPHNLPPLLRFIKQDRIRKKGYTSLKSTVDFVQNLCQSLIEKPDPMIVPVYAFKYIGYNSNNGYYSYTYDMLALGIISEQEKNVINLISDRWDRWKELPSKTREQRVLDCWANHRPLMQFLEKVIKDNKYHDLHSGNIMMDLEENYRLIDLEGFKQSRTWGYHD